MTKKSFKYKEEANQFAHWFNEVHKYKYTVEVYHSYNDGLYYVKWKWYKVAKL
jgi:hypothetical protein